jgi:hypothetical protein
MIYQLSKVDYRGDLKTYDNMVLQRLAAKAKEGHFSAARPGMTGTYPALFHTAEMPSEGTNLVYHFAIVETKQSFYQVSAWTLKSRAEENGPALDQVIGSFSSKDDAP